MSQTRTALRAARTHLRAGRAERARQAYLEVLASSPSHVEALVGVGHALRAAGKLAEALDWYRGAVRRSPAPELRRELEQLEPPAAPTAAGTDSERLLAEGRIDEVRRWLEQHAGADPRRLLLLGRACLADGDVDAAQAALLEALRLAPKEPTAHLWLADVHAARGAREQAEAALRQAIALRPGFGLAWLRLARLRRFDSVDDPDAVRVRELLDGDALSPEDTEALHFARGKVLDDVGAYDEAFEHFRQANALHRAREPFDVRALLQLMERIARVCDASLFSRLTNLGSESAAPVWIVGVPRSGTTLVEQIIASHPRAYGVGELRTFSRLTADLPSRLRTKTPFPECLSELDAPSAQALAAQYLARLGRDAPPDVLRICDKMLSHVMLVGLFALLFPRGTVIHCQRSLMDAGLSMYMHPFSGFGVGYAYDLDDIGSYARQCDLLMRHWRASCPLRIVTVRYESLVAEPERGVRELLDAVGLDFDARCLESHRAERQVRTVSEWQVRQPVHTRSVARARHYERHLSPLLKYESG